MAFAKQRPGEVRLSSMTPSSTEIILGIDLGTTFSTVAYVDAQGKAVVIPDASGANATPSVLWRDDDRILAGYSAEAMRGESPARIIECLKRAIGEPLDLYSWSFRDEEYDATEWTAVYLRYLVTQADNWLLREGIASQPTRNVVITIPAYFNQTKRLATIRAAELAGLYVRRILNEPTAAAIAHGVTLERPKTILVWDLGGGTFDLTLLRCNGNRSFDVMMNSGVTLGGKDWDNALKNHFVNELEDHPGVHRDIIDRRWLTASAVEAKLRLSSEREATVFARAGEEEYPITITRERFERLTAKCLACCETVVQNLIEQAQQRRLIAGWNSIDELVLVGGSSRMPMVQACARRLFNRDITLGEFDLAIAKGAALLSTLPIDVTDVTPKSLGIVIRQDEDDKVKIMIEKDTAIPCERTKSFNAVSYAMVRVVQGTRGNEDEERNLEGFDDIGRFSIGNKTRQPVEICYRYNLNGTMSVTYKLKGQNPVTHVIAMQQETTTDTQKARVKALFDCIEFDEMQHARPRA
jgi:molecular chaperone DnaK